MTQILPHFCKNRGSDESAGSPVCSARPEACSGTRGHVSHKIGVAEATAVIITARSHKIHSIWSANGVYLLDIMLLVSVCYLSLPPQLDYLLPFNPAFHCRPSGLSLHTGLPALSSLPRFRALSQDFVELRF